MTLLTQDLQCLKLSFTDVFLLVRRLIAMLNFNVKLSFP